MILLPTMVRIRIRVRSWRVVVKKSGGDDGDDRGTVCLGDIFVGFFWGLGLVIYLGIN